MYITVALFLKETQNLTQIYMAITDLKCVQTFEHLLWLKRRYVKHVINFQRTLTPIT